MVDYKTNNGDAKKAYSTPTELYKAGVKFAIAGEGNALYSYRLPWDAGVAVAFGLPEEEALKAVTINAAEMMGVADKVGSLCRYWISNEVPRVFPGIADHAGEPSQAGRFLLSVNRTPIAWTDPHGAAIEWIADVGSNQ